MSKIRAEGADSVNAQLKKQAEIPPQPAEMAQPSDPGAMGMNGMPEMSPQDSGGVGNPEDQITDKLSIGRNFFGSQKRFHLFD